MVNLSSMFARYHCILYTAIIRIAYFIHETSKNQTLPLCNIHSKFIQKRLHKEKKNIASILHNKQLPPFTLWLQLCIWPCYYIWRKTSHCFPPSRCLGRIRSRHRTFVFIYNNEPTMGYTILWLILAVLHHVYEITVDVVCECIVCSLHDHYSIILNKPYHCINCIACERKSFLGYVFRIRLHTTLTPDLIIANRC